MNSQIQEEAAQWLVDFRFDEPDAVAREQFAAWLRTSPEHVRAYLELCSLWEDAARYDSEGSIDIESLIALTRANTNVVALEPDFAFNRARPEQEAAGSGAPEPGPAAKAFPRRLRVAAAAAAAVFFAGLVGVWVAFYSDPTYATDVGEFRSIRLADGSNVKLNATSRIQVHFSDGERVVRLLSGQALFQVAHNKSRPFIVICADARVRAVGTEFDVNRSNAKTIVTVLEGRVAVLPHVQQLPVLDARLVPPPIEVGAGEQVAFTANVTPHPRITNVATATAWTQQQLVFESTPLSDVAVEFNRFNSRRLVIEGDAPAQFHVSGTFPALDPASLTRLVLFLREQPGIVVIESSDRIVIRKN